MRLHLVRDFFHDLGHRTLAGFAAKGHVIDANLTPPLVPGDIRSSHPLYALLR